MAEQNPIRYQDLITPDDSIENLILQLTELNKAYTGMADSVKQQASQVAASLRQVSGATASGQKATRDANQEVNRLAKAYQDLEFAQSDTAKRIQELKNLRNEENRMTKLQIQLSRSAAGSYNALSAQYSLNKLAINNLTKAERENDPAAKKLIEDTKAIYEEMKRMQEATGKFQLNVGNYENAINNAIGVNSKWFGSLQQIGSLFEGGFANGVKLAGQVVAGFGKQLLALLANPIVATIAAITAAFLALSEGIKSSEENTNALNRVLAPFERIATACVAALQAMAAHVLAVVEGFEKMAMWAARLYERLPLVGNAIKAVNDALAENIELEKQKAMLDKMERTKNVANAKLARDVARWRNQAAQTSDAIEKQRLLNLAKEGEKKIMTNELKLAQKDLAIKEARARQAGNDKKANDELAQARVRLYKAEEQYYTGTMRLERQLTSLRDKNKGGGGGKTSTKDTSAEQAKKQLDEQRKIEDARIALIEDSYVRERMTIITSYNRKIEDAKAQYGQETELAVAYEEEKQKKLADLFEKEAKDTAAAEKKKADEQLRAIKEGEQKREQAIREAEQKINAQYELDISFADLEQSENKKTQLRLEAEKKRLQALLALYQKDGKKLTDVEVQTIKNGIAAVDQELEKNKKDKDFYDILGFNLSDEKKEAINTSLSYAMDALSTFMDAYVEAAEKKRQMADAEVERTQSLLQAEVEARANGYANEVETARKEYELARKNQQKAIEQQKKAQKAQLALDTITQASNLVTASSLIWSQLGFPWAIPALAVMWGSFAAAKIKAASMTSSGADEEYAEGTVELLQGGSHQSGNDVDLGRKPNGTRRRAEGGEFFAVINKRNSRRYRHVIPDVVNSLNQGTFAEKYMGAYSGGDIIVSEQKPVDITELSSDVRRIREQGEHERYVDGSGNTVVRYRNIRRVIRR